jgi:hypothetical protein
MEKKLLREAHNLQDKALKPDYRDRFKDEGANYDRGGVIPSEKRAVWVKGNFIHFNVRAFLIEDKRRLIETLSHHYKFNFTGHIGTIPQLAKKPAIASEIIERFEMTKRSILNALEIIDHVKHPTKNRLVPMLEFTCFFQPVEPFRNPVFNKDFAFRMNIPKMQP